MGLYQSCGLAITAGSAFGAFYLYAKKSLSQPLCVYGSDAGDGLKSRLLAACPVLSELYTPPWYCYWGNVHTIVRQLCRTCPQFDYDREIHAFDDGGQAALDWLHPGDSEAGAPAAAAAPQRSDGERRDCEPEAPVVLVLPGLTGSSRTSTYVLHAMIEVTRLRYRAVVFNMRAIEIPLTSAKTFSAVSTDDVQTVVAHVRRRYPRAPIMLLGFSLGGMNTFQYLARRRRHAERAGVRCAMIVSAPWDPLRDIVGLERFWPRVLFNRVLADALKDVVKDYGGLFASKVDWAATMRSGTVREFDTHFTAPMAGYGSCAEYYQDARLCDKVEAIGTPLLCVHAADDCFASLDSVPLSALAEHKSVALVLAQAGGHTAFIRRSLNEQNLVEVIFRQAAPVMLAL